jgi:hypothetical protein
MNRIKQNTDGTASLSMPDGSFYCFPNVKAAQDWVNDHSPIDLVQLEQDIYMGEALLELDDWSKGGN